MLGDGRSLYLQSGVTASMRSMATAAIHGAVCERYRRRNWRVDTMRNGRAVSVAIWVPRWWLIALGLVHLVTWWGARRLVCHVAKSLNIDVEPRVRLR